MATTRGFSYNTGATLSGTTQVGNLAVATGDVNYRTGLEWVMGPDEDLGYVIARPINPFRNRAGGQGSAGVAFFRSGSKTDSSFIAQVNSIFDQNFSTGASAKSWLNSNGYWTSYSTSSVVTSNLFVKLDASNYTSGFWLDESGNSNNATINGATWLSTDGGIFDLNGISNTISIPHNSSLSLSTSVQRTIQVWVKFDVLPALNSQGQPVFGKLSSSSGFDGYWGGLFSNGGKVRVVTNGTSIQKVSDSSTNPISIDTWYLYTFISQITSAANTTKVYINTTEVVSTSHGTDTYSESNPLYLGFIGSGVSSPYLNGKIGACYFYTGGLSVSDITTNFEATRTKYGV